MGGRGPADHGTAVASAGTGEVFARIERLRAGAVPAGELGRACAELREAVLQLAEDGSVPFAEARRISRGLDELLGRALEDSLEPARALEALDRAGAAGVDDLPRLALEGSSAADSAVLLVAAEGRLLPRSHAGLDDSQLELLCNDGAVSAEAAARGEEIHLRTAVKHPLALAEQLVGTRALFAAPVMKGDQVLGVLRIGTRTAYAFSAHELQLFRALAARAAALLDSDAALANREARARHATAAFEALIEAAPVPIVSVDLTGAVRIWNRAAAELFGWTAEEVLGQPNPSVDDAQREESNQILREVHAGAMVRDRLLGRRRKDGTTVDVAFSASPLLGASGRVAGSIAILIDVSQKKRSAAEAERTARFREHILGIVGHDLRNPLTAIVTSAQLLLRYSALDDRQRKVVTRIAQSADRMARMIEELLDFTRTRLGGRFPIAPRRVDLREISEQCVEELLLAHPTRRIEMTTRGDVWGDFDPGRLAQVVSNLVGNAIQHSADGSPIQIELRDEGEWVVFETHNEGPPIPAEMLPHVFEPGRRGEGTRTSGLGLGLYIAREIVLAHGGSIDARSEPGDGTVFTVRIPRKPRRPSVRL